MRSRIMDVLVVVTALCAVVLTGMVIWERIRDASGRRVPGTEAIRDWLTYGAEGHRQGSLTAEVTIVEFGDYECPGCRSFQKSLDAVLAQLADYSIALVYRHYPLNYHPLAYTAARAAECAADQGRFFEYHSMLYQNSSWMAIGSRAFEDYAKVVSVPDSARFADCLYEHEKVPAIERDIAAGDRLGKRGVPTIMVNDRLVVNAVPDSAGLIALIRQALAEKVISN